MKNSLTKVIVDIIVLLAVLIVVDVFVGWVGKKYVLGISKVPRNSDASIANYDLNAATPDVAIIGSSTAISHYNPEIIHDSLLISTGNDYLVFNMGMSRQKMAYNYYAIKSLLDRKMPKILIIDVWASYLSENTPTSSGSFPPLRPHVKINSNIDEMFRLHKQKRVEYMSNMYCFNTELMYLLVSAFKPVVKNGFKTRRAEMEEPVLKDMMKDTGKLLALSVEEFDGMIKLVEDNEIKTVIVMSPTLCASDTTSVSYHYIKTKCEEKNIPLLDYSNDTIYLKAHYFRDQRHMNCWGADKFTKDLMRDIKRYVTF